MILQTSMLNRGAQSAMGSCALCYIKLILCNGFAEIYAQLERGQSAIGICTLFYIYM